MNVFLEKGLSQIPRILGFMDREPSSRTHGCCDRAFWHYRTTDFSNARMQEAALALTVAWLAGDSQNCFLGSGQLRAGILAAVRFWQRRRHADGSVDESYPFERHFCATAFTLYAMTQTFLLLGETLHDDWDKTADFLCRHDNGEVANQMACAAGALYNMFLLTKKEKYKTGFEQKTRKLLQMQDAAGWFSEYGGFDLGYDTITLSFLAGIYKKTGRTDILAAAEKCVGNMAARIDADGYFSPEGMSRRTQFLYPYGFAVFAPDILQKIAQGLSRDMIVNPAWMDDRYCVPLAANYLLTGYACSAGNA